MLTRETFVTVTWSWFRRCGCRSVVQQLCNVIDELGDDVYARKNELICCKSKRIGGRSRARTGARSHFAFPRIMMMLELCKMLRMIASVVISGH